MLIRIREHAQSWVAAFIIVLLSISFAFWGIQYYVMGHTRKKPVARVNGVDITYSEFQQTYNRLRNAWLLDQGKQGILDETIQKQLRQKALHDQILRHVLIDKAQQFNLQVPPDEVAGVIQSFPIFKIKGVFSPQRFEMILPRLGYTESSFLTALMHDFLVNQMRQSIIGSTFALPHEVNRLFRIMGETRSVRYIRLPLARFSASLPLSQTMIEDYYQKNKKHFKMPEEISIAYVHLSKAALAKQVKVTPQALQDFYMNNLELYTPTHASHHSNQSSTQDLNDVKPLSFQTVKAKVKQAVTQQIVEQQFADKSDELADWVYTHPQTLKPASKALGIPIETTPFFSRSNIKDIGWLNNPKVLAVAFSNEVLHQGNNSSLITLPDGSILALRIYRHRPPVIPPLDRVIAEVKSALRRQLGLQKIKQLADRLESDLRVGQRLSVSRLMSQYNLRWQTESNLRRGQSHESMEPAFIDLAFRLMPHRSQSTGSDIGRIQLKNGDYIVMTLEAISQIKQTNQATKKRYATVQEMWQQSLAQWEYNMYIHALKDESKITIYNKSF